MPSSAGSYWDLTKRTFKEWQADKASRLAAALSYYALFSIGPLLLIVVSVVGFVYGAAGSLVVLLVWVYYSAQILFVGAEFTKVYADAYGSRVVPAEDAQRIPEAERAQRGEGQGDRRETRRPGGHETQEEGNAEAPHRQATPWYAATDWPSSPACWACW